MFPTTPVHFDDRSCHIRRTSFVRVVADQVMRKGTGFEIEDDWFLDGNGIGGDPAAIRRGRCNPWARKKNGRGHLEILFSVRAFTS